MIIRTERENIDKRIDFFLSEKIDESRSHIQKLIQDEKVQVNGKIIKSKYKIHKNDEIEVTKMEVIDYEVKAQNIPLDIRYEDEYLLIINKPTNMVVHPAPGNYENTLVNALMYYSKNLSDLNGEFRPGIVHRIDKDTSGLLIVAKDNKTHQKLSDMIRNKTIKRKYKVIVHGDFIQEEAKIIAPIGRDVKDRKKMTVTAKNSKEAITHIKLLNSNDSYSLIECELQTGRTHQIRVHLQYIKYPVVGDPKYGRKKTIDTEGQALHSYKLEFIHPMTEEEIKIICELPREFEKTLEEIKLKDV